MKRLLHIKLLLLISLDILFGYSALGQSIGDTPPIEQHVCSEAEITYSFFGYEGSTIKRYVDGIELTPPVVLNTPANNVPSSSPVYQKGSFTHTWDATSYSPKSTAYLLQIKEFSANCESDLISLNVYVHRKPAVSTTVTPISCNGLSNGKIIISNTTPPFTPPFTPSSNFVVIQEFSLDGSNYTKVSEFSNLGPGNYTLYYRYTYDDNGTTMIVSESSGTITGIEVAEPEAVTVSSSKVDITCYGASTGSINITAAGGVGPYTYSWTGTGVNATAEDQTNLSAGNYSVIVSDANGCSSVSHDVTLSEPGASVSVSSSKVDITCYGASTGSINITAAGGVGPYTYSWTGTGVNATAEDQTNLSAGNYSVIVSDANGCSSVSHDVTLSEPGASVSVSSSKVDITCYGASTGSINITAAGGVGPYTYLWTGTGVNATAEDQTNLSAGNYSVIVSDANGCSSVSHDVTLTESAILNITINADNNSICEGELVTITATAGGGTVLYTYEFYLNGTLIVSNTSYTISENQLSSNVFANGDELTVKVIDNNSCEKTSDKIIMTVNDLPNTSDITHN